MSQCPNCGNPWLESYEAAGKCDACGHVPSAVEAEALVPEPDPVQEA